ncbi:MAG: hypothetical protein HYT79_07835 [Elusimicrobia bacterium]|nr:hypothetical protein [Elusimicrobiota bacterium]
MTAVLVREGLSGTPWNKGLTKLTHPSVAKMALSRSGKRYGPYRSSKPLNLSRSAELAELIGIILGDGSLAPSSRTQRLLISLDSRVQDQVRYTAYLMKNVFEIEPKVVLQKGAHCNRVYIYHNGIAEALGLPLGNKIKNDVGVPRWIKDDDSHLKLCLRGLFETDGSYYEQPHNSTYVLDFKNKCRQLLQDVFDGLVQLGYRPQKGGDYVRLAKKAEVQKFAKEINFRNFSCRIR